MKQNEEPMYDCDDSVNIKKKRKWLYFFAAIINFCLVPFYIIAAAFIEYKISGTNYVEDFCRKIGIHSFIGEIINFMDL